MSENVLTPKQKKGLAAMLTQPTLTAAAQAAGTSEKTLYRWLALPAFAAELKARQAGIIDAAAGRPGPGHLKRADDNGRKRIRPKGGGQRMAG